MAFNITVVLVFVGRGGALAFLSGGKEGDGKKKFENHWFKLYHSCSSISMELGVARRVMLSWSVIGHGDLSSNPGRDILNYT